MPRPTTLGRAEIRPAATVDLCIVAHPAGGPALRRRAVAHRRSAQYFRSREARHRIPQRRRTGRLPARPAPPGHVAARPAPRARRARRRRDPAVRGGRRRARPRRGALHRPADDRARLDPRHRRPRPRRLRPPVPPDERRACGRAGSGSPTPRAAARRCRRSPSTASATCTSSATATTASRSPARSGATRSTRTSSRSSRGSAPSARSSSATCRSRATSACSTNASPCPPGARDRIALTDPWRYAWLAEGVEAWGFRDDAGPRRVHRPPHRRRGAGSTRTTCRSSTCCATRA